MPQMLISKRLAHRSSFSARLIHAAATESGTVKMVVQGRQIQLTPSIKQYAEEKVMWPCMGRHAALCVFELVTVAPSS